MLRKHFCVFKECNEASQFSRGGEEGFSFCFAHRSMQRKGEMGPES